MDILPLVVMFGVFFVLMYLAVPISFAIGISSLATLMMMFPLHQALVVTAQKTASGFDSFTILSLPFFILAGAVMNSGGIARRLINLAKVIGSPLPGSLLHTTILANMMFGALSGSAVASAAAVGGVMAPEIKKAGIDPSLGAATNIASCTTGLLIPPSGAFIIYSLIAGGVSVSALFIAGYLPGILLGLVMMAVTSVAAYRRGYTSQGWPTLAAVVNALVEAILPLGMVLLVIGGMIAGMFTATEASAVAAVYALVLALLVYREITPRDLGPIIMTTVETSAIVLFMVGVSVVMSWAMTFADMPYMIEQLMGMASDNLLVTMLIINVLLLIIGTFMDLTPGLLIFTPIFLPIVQGLGMDPVHFGVVITLNLCIGIVTPPVGSALFVGASVAGVSLRSVMSPLNLYYVAFLIVLALVTIFPSISLFLPRLLLGYGG
jgi:tripartite ATP-independent transporter DctM subunit